MDTNDMQNNEIQSTSVVQTTKSNIPLLNKNPMHRLTDLPNELWLMSLSYLNTDELFKGFYGLNKRFNNLVCHCTRRVMLPNKINDYWIATFIPQIQDNIVTICLKDTAVECIFSKQWLFPNLKLINVRGNGWYISLRIKETDPRTVLISSLNLLRKLNFEVNMFPNDTQHYMIDNNDNDLKNVLCPCIEYLSIDQCNMRSLFYICSCMPNLLHMKLKFKESILCRYFSIDQFDLRKRTTNLITLNIKATCMINLTLLVQLINSCKISLKYLTLHVVSFKPVDGNDLEPIFKSCQNLVTLKFFFEFSYEQINIINYQRSFQTEWWLDKDRPPVYIQHNNNNHSVSIVSMPCHLSFPFEDNLFNWYLNKGDQNSTFVQFTNVNQIHFTNKINQTISLEYLYSIDRIFTSSNQCLSFDFCQLEVIEIIFELLMDDTSITAILPNVNQFIVSGQHKLDALTLCVWLLIIPNLELLDISKLIAFNLAELAYELKDMLDTDQRLKTNFDHLKQIIILSSFNHMDKQTFNELTTAFQKVFINAKIL